MIMCQVCKRGFDPKDPQRHAVITGHQPDGTRQRFPGSPSDDTANTAEVAAQ